MNQLKYRPIVVLNLLLLKTTVVLAEWALKHREAVRLGRAYAPVVLGSFAAYFAGRVVGQAIVNGIV
ncbi:MAG: hypothetical protein ACRDHG_05400 [Anaerolineales bacterium]